MTIEEESERCGVERLRMVVIRRRMRWYGHVRRREEDNILRYTMDEKVDERWTSERPYDKC